MFCLCCVAIPEYIVCTLAIAIYFGPLSLSLSISFPLSLPLSIFTAWFLFDLSIPTKLGFTASPSAWPRFATLQFQPLSRSGNLLLPPLLFFFSFSFLPHVLEARLSLCFLPREFSSFSIPPPLSSRYFTLIAPFKLHSISSLPHFPPFLNNLSIS